jgi:amino acid adenylation domain-containing protein
MTEALYRDNAEDEVYRFPASLAQERLWLLDQLAPGSPVYNIDRSVHLRGALDVGALERSLEEIVRRHEALRTTFVAHEGRPMQVITPLLSVQLTLVDLQPFAEQEREQRAAHHVAAESQRPFDLACSPLLRTTLLRLGPREHILLLIIHHIIADEWSLGVLLHELATLYSAYAQGQPSPLRELPIQYADFAEWQRAWLEDGVLAEQLDYWQAQLASVPAVLEMPADRPRPKVQTFRGATRPFALAGAVGEGLARLSREEGVTLFMTLLAAFQVLLQRYTGQDDVVVGSPIAGRTRTDLEGLIGFFVNTLVLRTDLAGDPTFRALLTRVRDVAWGAYAHQDVPFARLVEELNPARDLSHNPLFQVMFVLQNVPDSTMEFHGLNATCSMGEPQAAKVDLSVYLAETGDGLVGSCEYDTDLFDASTIERLIGHFQTLLSGIVANPEQRLSKLPLLSEAERHQLLVAWNDTAAEYPDSASIAQLFVAQAEKTPAAVAVAMAVACGDAQLTYRELDQRSNQLARHLQELGVGLEARVGICVERSAQMVVGLLGILKAGAAYVPLDPAYPQERLAFMLEDAQVAVLLTEQRLVDRLPRQTAPRVRLDADWAAVARRSMAAVDGGVSADSLAYVMYTSGSTGRPKGVMGLHRGAVNRLHWMWQTYPFGAGEVCCQKTSLSFVDSVWEIFGPLLRGIPTLIIPDDAIADLRLFVQMLAAGRVTRLVLVPSLLRAILDTYPDLQARLPDLRTWVSSGEALPVELARRFRERMPHARLVNLYGQTEVAADVTYYDTSISDISTCLPIGRPIFNTQIYVLDRNLQPVPIGVPGEVCAGGAGLARGYINRSELTARAFVPHPFADAPGARLYRTGDLGRCLEDGNIEYLGRLDHQVKLRGFRVELSEIETLLGQHPAVGQCAVLLREDVSGDPRLVAYVVPHPGAQATASALRAYAREHLPEFMVPAACVILDGLPLSPNGKLDRARLPRPAPAELAGEGTCAAPRTPEEKVLAGIWARVLGLEHVGVHDSFFDLGGHSLAATRVVSRIRDALEVDVPLRSMFEYPTIAGLAEVIERLMATRGARHEPALRPLPRTARRAGGPSRQL